MVATAYATTLKRAKDLQADATAANTATDAAGKVAILNAMYGIVSSLVDDAFNNM